MTERQWVSRAAPFKMLKWARAGLSDRRLRLFACACARRVWPLLTEESRRAVEVAELFADGAADADELADAEESAEDATTAVYGTAKAAETPPFHAADAAAWAATADPEKAATFAVQAVLEACRTRAERAAERAALAGLLRDVAGNPFRPAAPPGRSWLTWNGGTVRRLAEEVYETRAFDRLGVLADALEDAGCADEEILSHLRGAGPHVRGCWALDLVLGKE